MKSITESKYPMGIVIWTLITTALGFYLQIPRSTLFLIEVEKIASTALQLSFRPPGAISCLGSGISNERTGLVDFLFNPSRPS
jgi:hypothetical protein